MTVGELIAKLSEIEDLDKGVCLGGDGAYCVSIDENTEDGDEVVFINFSWEN